MKCACYVRITINYFRFLSIFYTVLTETTSVVLFSSKQLRQCLTFTGLPLQRSLNEVKSVEVVDNEDVLVVRVGGHGLQLRFLDSGAHADGEDGDALVSQPLGLLGRGAGVLGLAVCDDDGDLGSVGSARQTKRRQW